MRKRKEARKTRRKINREKEWQKKKPARKEKDSKLRLEVKYFLFSRSSLEVWYS